MEIEQAEKVIPGHEMAEIRLDLNRFGKDEILRLSRLNTPLIYTFRARQGVSDKERYEKLLFAMEHGAAWIDLDIENEESFINSLSKQIEAHRQCKLIISYHNFLRTPVNRDLYELILRAGAYKAHLIKIACLSHGERDNRRMLAFNRSFSNVLAFCMGEKGKSTRYRSLMAGAPFTYVCLRGHETAPGQMDRETMIEQMNKDRENLEGQFNQMI